MHFNEVSKYIDLRFILPTPNMCQRLFSKAVYALNSRREGFLPTNFNCQLLLLVNARLWGMVAVHEMHKVTLLFRLKQYWSP